MTASETTESPTQSTRYDASEWACRGCGFVMTVAMRRTRKDGDRCPRCNAYRWQVAPFIGVWADDFIHKCTKCGFLLSEIERRIPWGVPCPSCGANSWTESKGVKSCTENGQIPVDEQKRRTIGLFNPVTGAYNREWRDRVLRRGRGKRTVEHWIKIAFAWLFLGTVLLSGLLLFGGLLVTVGVVKGITTTYQKLKTGIKSLLI